MNLTNEQSNVLHYDVKEAHESIREAYHIISCDDPMAEMVLRGLVAKAFKASAGEPMSMDTQPLHKHAASIPPEDPRDALIRTLTENLEKVALVLGVEPDEDLAGVAENVMYERDDLRARLDAAIDKIREAA